MRLWIKRCQAVRITHYRTAMLAKYYRKHYLGIIGHPLEIRDYWYGNVASLHDFFVFLLFCQPRAGGYDRMIQSALRFVQQLCNVFGCWA